MGRTREVFAEYGFEAYITVNLMDKRAMKCVVSLGCEWSDPERMRAARECIQQMEKEYMDAGYILYRAGVDSLNRVLDSDDSFWKTAKDLKQVLDPKNIIAPRRYNLI